MRNLTVRVPDEVYNAARVYAKRHRTSISSVVADFLFTIRNLARSTDPPDPRAAVDLHCDQLRENRDTGRVNFEPFTDKEFLAVARYALKAMN